MSNKKDYSPIKEGCNGITVDFSFDWKILEPEDLVIILEDDTTGEQVILDYLQDYTVEFEAVGGSITTKTAYPKGYNIILARETSLYQGSSYSTSTGFQGSEIERSFDRASMDIQDLRYTLQRAIKVAVGSKNLDLVLPAPDAGKTLKWNQEQTGLVNSTINVDTLEYVANRIYDSVDNIDTVADINEDVTAVANNEENINKAVQNESNINKVVANETNINIVATHINNVDNVANNKNNVDNVANNKDNINKCSANMSAILDAPNQANIATNKASIATQQAEIAITQAGISTENKEETKLALAQAQSLRESTEILNFIDCGNFDDVEAGLFDCGTLGDSEDDLIDCGTLDNLLLAREDIKNIINLPLLQQQANSTDEELSNAEMRIAKNENDIVDIQEHLELHDTEIAELKTRTTTTESCILTLNNNLADTNINLEQAKNRISQNEANISELQYLTDLFNYIECGTLGDTEDVVIDCGDLGDTEASLIDCLTLSESCVTKENLRDTALIPYLKSAVEDLKNKLNLAIEFIRDLQENGIDCGSMTASVE